MYKGFDLSDKVAVLTGSTRGMGLAIARGLAQCGAKVVVSSNTQEETDQGAHLLVKEGHEAKGVRWDVVERGDIERFAGEAKRAFGRADILFCLAGMPAPLGPLMGSDLAAFDTMLLSTVGNNLALIHQFIPDMAERRDGSIVVMSSLASMRANPVLGGYGAAKAALNGIVRSIAVEWGASNVRANAIAPTVVRTDFSKDLWGDPKRENSIISRIPARRLADADDIVGAAVLLASPAGSYITGQVLLVDGGRSIA